MAEPYQFVALLCDLFGLSGVHSLGCRFEVLCVFTFGCL